MKFHNLTIMYSRSFPGVTTVLTNSSRPGFKFSCFYVCVSVLSVMWEKENVHLICCLPIHASLDVIVISSSCIYFVLLFFFFLNCWSAGFAIFICWQNLVDGLVGLEGGVYYFDLGILSLHHVKRICWNIQPFIYHLTSSLQHVYAFYWSMKLCLTSQ